MNLNYLQDEQYCKRRSELQLISNQFTLQMQTAYIHYYFVGSPSFTSSFISFDSSI